MSNNNDQQIIMAEAQPAYDFDFIVQSLGLIPINGGKEAINPAFITNVCRAEDNPGLWIFALDGGDQCEIREEDMPAFEAQLRMRAEAFRRMMGGGTPGGLITPPTNNRRYRQ